VQQFTRFQLTYSASRGTSVIAELLVELLVLIGFNWLISDDWDCCSFYSFIILTVLPCVLVFLHFLVCFMFKFSIVHFLPLSIVLYGLWAELHSFIHSFIHWKPVNRLKILNGHVPSFVSLTSLYQMLHALQRARYTDGRCSSRQARLRLRTERSKMYVANYCLTPYCTEMAFRCKDKGER